MNVRILSLFLLFFILVSCGAEKQGIVEKQDVKEIVEAVDFSGTWQREDDTVISTIFIEQAGEQVKFDWKQEAKDGSWIIECDNQGECDKIQNGEKIEHYSFSIVISEDKKKLVVNWIAKDLKTSAVMPMIDEIEMIEDGKEILSKSITYDDEGNKVYAEKEYRFSRVENVKED